MIVIVREIIAIILFCTAIFAFYEIVLGASPVGMGLIGITLLLIAYWVWPSKRKGQRDEDRWYLEFIFELIIELPIRTLVYVLRLLFRSSKTDGGLDIDI